MDKKKIVIVDDDPDQQAGLRVRLLASGYEVASAGDAMQAVSVIRVWKSASRPVMAAKRSR